jgi:hypothetical protein
MYVCANIYVVYIHGKGTSYTPYIHTYTHTYIHAYTHTYIHVYRELQLLPAVVGDAGLLGDDFQQVQDSLRELSRPRMAGLRTPAR